MEVVSCSILMEDSTLIKRNYDCAYRLDTAFFSLLFSNFQIPKTKRQRDRVSLLHCALKMHFLQVTSALKDPDKLSWSALTLAGKLCYNINPSHMSKWTRDTFTVIRQHPEPPDQLCLSSQVAKI